MSLNSISIRGAREHNLQGIDVNIPRDRLVVITGLSGSGKSSLAFDTLYAEGQRKYVESLSAYARQFLDQLQKPNIESIEGLPPTIAIEQRSASHNPRSTVATTTEIYDYLRLLFARVGRPHCWHTDEKGKACGREIVGQSATQIIDRVAASAAGTKLMVLSPLVRGKKGHHKEIFEAMVRQGFVRARLDGQILDLRELKGQSPLKTQTQRFQAHDIEAVVDRLVVPAVASGKAKAGEEDSYQAFKGRLAESIELALKLAEGLVVISRQEGEAWVDQVFSEKFACPVHPECSLEELEPRLFSFNSPHGACPACGGLGTILEFDEELIVPDPRATLAEGAIEPWRTNGRQMNIYYNRLMRKFGKVFGVDLDTPFDKLAKKERRLLMYGSSGGEEGGYRAHFEGVIPNLQRRWQNTDSEFVKERLHQYQSEAACETCGGARLRKEAMYVFIEAEGLGEALAGKSGTAANARVNIRDVTAMTIEQAIGFFERIKLTSEQRQIAAPIIKELRSRLGFMISVGLNYLTLNRTTGSLSGGESQRIRLATQVGSGLVGCCYVLDEPTIGLHQRDNQRLISTLRHLTDIGNTVVVVEHDEDTIRAADYVIDMGPGPGRHGGQIVAEGTLEEVLRHPDSLTAKYLRAEMEIATPAQRRKLDHKNQVMVVGARENNLKSISAAFPLGGIVCVTGVSGSGKSTLVNQILLRAARRELTGAREKPGAHERVTGLKGIDRVIEVDQSPIGRTPRSNPATYTGAFDLIRALFTQTKEAKIRGYKPGRFSFNVKGGRCEACQGQGTKKIEMHFLPDVFVTCEECRGTRYNRQTLEVHYKGKSIADVLDMTVEEALGFFENFPRIATLLAALNDVGLSYVQLGQSSTTLSGGEAQRVKLATELGKRPTGHTLYVLDEPTTGLHFADIDKLLSVLGRLADQGNTIVVIEHNMDVIKCADWIIDLGPEGGDRGGEVVFTGTPEEIVEHKRSYTGEFLRTHMRVGGAVGAGV
ncbi:MAG: excinuclease ABC subunit UvrA [Phycisphaeraceae bacterium]|nr:excinuclease ABC subunit UvrA [Phycisphaeraceae bacterium]